MAKKVRIKGEARRIPQSKEEVAEDIAKMGSIQSIIGGIESDLQRKINDLTEPAMKRVGRLERGAARIFSGIEAFAGSRRDKLTSDGKKTIKLPTGHFGWRSLPLSADISDEEAAIAALEEAGLKKAVRTKKTIDKDELKKMFKAGVKKGAKRAAAAIAEVIKAIKSISMNAKRESFWIEPQKVELRLELAGEGKIKTTAAKSVNK